MEGLIFVEEYQVNSWNTTFYMYKIATSVVSFDMDRYTLDYELMVRQKEV